MSHPRHPDAISPATPSLAAEHCLPSKRIASSDDLGWQSVLARAYLDPEEAEEFTTASTPDLLVVVTISGTLTMEVERPAGWSRAVYRPGAIGVTAPGNSSTLRWRATSAEPLRSLHLHLSAGLLRNTAERLGSPELLNRLPDALLLDDPLVLAGGTALWHALEQRADPLYADSVARALASRMVSGRLLSGRSTRPTPEPPAFTASALKRVEDYMRDRLADKILLDDLASVAHISKYHFVRVFTKATGCTPHRYLVGLRMQRAGDLLRTSDHTVFQVSMLCGYASPGQFAGAFRRHHGVTPTGYRQDQRR